MGLRLPRPFKALRGLIKAWRGNRFELYRISYAIRETGDVGAFVWMEGPDMEPTVIVNAEEFYFDSNKTYIVDKIQKTTINGEAIPVYEIVDVEDTSDDDEVVPIPEKFLDQQIPPIDRRDKIFE